MAADGWDDLLAQPHVVDPEQAGRDLAVVAGFVPAGREADFRRELERALAHNADVRRALSNLERMLTAAGRSGAADPTAQVQFLLDNPHSLALLLQMLATSQFFGDQIVAGAVDFRFLYKHGAQDFDPAATSRKLRQWIAAADMSEQAACKWVRYIRKRELLRIGYRDITLGEPLGRITRSISDLADCIVDTALWFAHAKHAARHGTPRTQAGAECHLAVVGLGKLGGRELNYSSDIDLLLVYDHDGATDGAEPVAAADFFEAVVRTTVGVLTRPTADGQAYRVDLRLRPFGEQSSLCLSLERALSYYDRHGRTWERQMLVKARPIAGHRPLGEEFLRRVEGFVYRQYMSFVEINEVKAMKRRVARHAKDRGADQTDLKTGRGGIRDIEFVIQFLQLLYGRSMPQIRENNTLQALKKMVAVGGIHRDEHAALETAYRFLRKAEHRLQFMFDLQTHKIPTDPHELDLLARRLGYLPAGAVSPGRQFTSDLRQITDRNRRILDRLMLDLFPAGSDGGAADLPVAEPQPETDLVLDPNPSPERVERVLGAYPFGDAHGTYRTLLGLSQERVPFLSSLRCRHFFASIARDLLRECAATPDPDMTLNNLERVTDSLGAKGVLWESFSVHRPMLRLYVRLCGWSRFLANILINNPGMIDELLDVLVLGRRLRLEELRTELAALLKGAVDPLPIVRGFQQTQLLSIAARDILGKSDIRQVTGELSDLAEAVLTPLVRRHHAMQVTRFGPPQSAGGECGFAVLALGKFGGRELGYHSDLDLILVYHGDGATAGPEDGWSAGSDAGGTSNHHFFSRLLQGLVQEAGHDGPSGRLYKIDLRLRPTGGSGSLVLPLDAFADHYAGAGADLWERQALTRGRVVFATGIMATAVEEIVRHATADFVWTPACLSRIRDMRDRLQRSRSATDIKRGVGGIVDVEFAVQMMQLRHAGRHPEIRQPNIWQALDALAATGLWDERTVATFRSGYTFLRTVESRLRVIYGSSRDELPGDTKELRTLAQRLGYQGDVPAAQLQEDLRRHRQQCRLAYLHCMTE